MKRKYDALVRKLHREGKNYEVELEETSLQVSVLNGDQKDWFFMDFEELTNCCGIIEFGNFMFRNNYQLCTVDEMKLLVAYEFREAIRRYRGENKGIRLTMFITNGSTSSELFKDMIQEYFPTKYELVRTFKNMNTRKTLKTYIQNI